MPGRKIRDSITIRDWIDSALGAGCKSPAQVLEWIEQRKGDSIESPSAATIGRIMKDKGYHPTGIRWEKKGK